MRTLFIYAVAIAAFIGCTNLKKEEMKTNQNTSFIFPLGEKASPDNFVGEAWAAAIVADDTTFNCPIYNVTFEASARNNWHKHPGGQILLVTRGVGYFQERGKSVQLLKEGDVVKIGRNVEHWHGASPDGRFTHIAISTNARLGEPQWLEPVADSDYNSR